MPSGAIARLSIIGRRSAVLIPSSVSVERQRLTRTGEDFGRRTVPEETPIAIVHDAATYAVMMGTPADLEDFGLGFSLTEGVIASPDEVRDIEVAESELGIEVRLWLEPGRAAALTERKRNMAGPTGCGLCGVDSLAAVQRTRLPQPLQITPLSPEEIFAAVASIDAVQTLGRETRAVHAAGFWRKGEGLVLLREDVGRHNALDKLAGALARRGESAGGVIVLTSRISVEMAQKAAILGAPVIAAVSAPTALAIRTAESAGTTLIAVARPDSFEVFAHPERIAARESI